MTNDQTASVDLDQIEWLHIRTTDWGGGPERTYEAANVEHAGCGGTVRLIHLHDAMEGLLGARSECLRCGDDLTPGAPEPEPASDHTIQTAQGPVTLAARMPVAGLHVYDLGNDTKPALRWRLGHHSGLALGGFPTEEAATRAARRIGYITDWKRTAEQLQADGAIDRDLMFELIKEQGGTALRRAT